jgi:site-specific recombinase XerD
MIEHDPTASCAPRAARKRLPKVLSRDEVAACSSSRGHEPRGAA